MSGGRKRKLNCSQHIRYLHLGLDVGADRVGLFGERGSERVVGVLFVQLVLQGGVSLRHHGHRLQNTNARWFESNPRGKEQLYKQVAVRLQTHLLPLAVDALGGDGGVGVCAAQLDTVALGDLLHLSLDGLDGLALLVGLRQRGLELLVGCDQTLMEETRTGMRGSSDSCS